MFNRWAAMKDEMSSGGGRERRPYLASECKVLPEAERWRRQVIGEISRKVAEIQNAGLGEARIRDLNDEINKLLREKGHWERQIKTLGGPDYAVTAAKMFDGEGREVPGSSGYKYFGAAKDLPGVRELFASDAPRKARTRAEIFRGITPDYYGYRDEEDGELVAAEEAGTRVAVAAAVRDWEAARAAKRAARVAAAGAVGGSTAAATASALSGLVEDYGDDDDAGPAASGSAAAVGAGAGSAAGGAMHGHGYDDDEDEDDDLSSALSSAAFKAHVPLPSQREIEAAVLERKRALLLAKYVGSSASALGAGPAIGGGAWAVSSAAGAGSASATSAGSSAAPAPTASLPAAPAPSAAAGREAAAGSAGIAQAAAAAPAARAHTGLRIAEDGE